jgi:phospholipase A-2-activating protein
LQDYDFVFSVDIQEGQPPIKLPYNKGEDPWVSAQKFVHDNDLSQMFLDTIAGFIIKNSGAEAVPAPASSGYVDPFTGGSRYVPSGAGPSTNATSANPDPFTGGSSYTSTAARQALGPNLPVVKEYHLFEQSNLDGLAGN